MVTINLKMGKFNIYLVEIVSGIVIQIFFVSLLVNELNRHNIGK